MENSKTCKRTYHGDCFSSQKPRGLQRLPNFHLECEQKLVSPSHRAKDLYVADFTFIQTQIYIHNARLSENPRWYIQL